MHINRRYMLKRNTVCKSSKKRQQQQEQQEQQESSSIPARTRGPGEAEQIFVFRNTARRDSNRQQSSKITILFSPSILPYHTRLKQYEYLYFFLFCFTLKAKVSTFRRLDLPPFPIPWPRATPIRARFCFLYRASSGSPFPTLVALRQNCA